MWANRSQLLFCYERPERITHVSILFRATWVICSWLLFKKEQISEEQREWFTFWLKKVESTVQKQSKNRQKILFCYERHERIALLLRATYAICKCSLFCYDSEQPERIAHGCSLIWASLRERAQSEWAKEQIPNPAKLLISPQCQGFILCPTLF